MDARFGRRSMLALAAAGALGSGSEQLGTGWGEGGFVWIAYVSLEAMAQGRGVYVPVSA